MPRRLLLAICLLFTCLPATSAVSVSTGDQVVLKTKPNTKGVPFHSEARSSMKGRILSGTQVGVLALHPNNWLEIEKHDGEMKTHVIHGKQLNDTHLRFDAPIDEQLQIRQFSNPNTCRRKE